MPGLRGGDEGRLRRAARARASWALARHNTVYYPSLTIKGAIQAIRVVTADRRRQDADRELDLPPEGRAADELLQRTVHVHAADQLADVGGRPRRPACLPRRSRKACAPAATSGSACTATSTRPRSAQADVTTNGTSEISMRNQFRAWAQVHDADDVRAAMTATPPTSAQQLIDFVLPRGAPARREALRRVERAVHRRRASTGCRWRPTSPTASTTPRSCTRTSCCASCASSG